MGFRYWEGKVTMAMLLISRPGSVVGGCWEALNQGKMVVGSGSGAGMYFWTNP